MDKNFFKFEIHWKKSVDLISMEKPLYKSVSNASIPLHYSNKKTPEKNMQQGIEKWYICHGSSIDLIKSNSYWCIWKNSLKNSLKHDLCPIFFCFFLTRSLTWSAAQKVLNVPKKSCVRIFILENVAFWAAGVGFESRILTRIPNFGKYWVRLGVRIRKNIWVSNNITIFFGEFRLFMTFLSVSL